MTNTTKLLNNDSHHSDAHHSDAHHSDVHHTGSHNTYSSTIRALIAALLAAL
ncbi:MAG: hypothetical protein ACJAYF_000093 [Arenicella sp.]|jgi:hypothetical protein